MDYSEEQQKQIVEVIYSAFYHSRYDCFRAFMMIADMLEKIGFSESMINLLKHGTQNDGKNRL